MPVVSRAYMTACMLIAVAVAVDAVSPFSLYFNWKLISSGGELWRVASSFLYFGPIGLQFALQMYFLVHYSRALEEHSFRGRTADYVWCLTVCAALIVAGGRLVGAAFLGGPLLFAMVYVWARRSPGVHVHVLGLLPCRAPRLPWVMLGLSAAAGGSPVACALGIAAGHVYWYAADVWPALAAARGWRRRQLLATPSLLRLVCGGGAPAVLAPLPAAAGAPGRPGGGVADVAGHEP